MLWKSAPSIHIRNMSMEPNNKVPDGLSHTSDMYWLQILCYHILSSNHYYYW